MCTYVQICVFVYFHPVSESVVTQLGSAQTQTHHLNQNKYILTRSSQAGIVYASANRLVSESVWSSGEFEQKTFISEFLFFLREHVHVMYTAYVNKDLF